MKILWWVVLALIALALVLFAIANRQTVSLGFWLLPGAAVELPLYLLVLVTLVIGFFAGQLVTWVGGWRWRREARRSRERIAMLERELEAERLQRAEVAPVARLPR
ncbi:MAG: lipopolysaccharide assembly protein LapA domain-containing protein [Stellaceae bacterium]